MHFWGVTLNDSRGVTLNAFRGSELVNFYSESSFPVTTVAAAPAGTS